MKKRIVSVLLVIAMLLSGVNCYAALPGDDSVQPMYQYTQSASASLTFSGSTANYSGRLTGGSSVTKITVALTLQKKTLLWWDDVETWNKTSASTSIYLERSLAVNSGKYRTKAVFTVYSGNNTETVTEYSAEKSC